MKRILFILLSVLPIWAQAQIVQAVRWTGEQVGDSVRLTATIDEGWHMTLISIGDEEIGEEIYESPYTITLAEPLPIRYNSCDETMCTAPEVYQYEPIAHSNQSSNTDDAASVDMAQNVKKSAQGAGIGSLLWIFLMGFLGGTDI